MKPYELYHGHQQPARPHYCPHFERETKSMLALIAKMFAGFVAFVIGVAVVLANAQWIDTVSPVAVFYVVWICSCIAGAYWLIKKLSK